jgi:hypothetical protein
VEDKTLNGAIQEAHAFGQTLLNNPCQETYGRYRGALVTVQMLLNHLGQPVATIPETVNVVKLVMMEGKI